MRRQETALSSFSVFFFLTVQNQLFLTFRARTKEQEKHMWIIDMTNAHNRQQRYKIVTLLDGFRRARDEQHKLV